MITEDERFIKIQGILTLSDIHPADCIKINDLMIELSKENQQLKIQISAREEEYKKLEDKLVETENWLRPAILQLMEIAKQDYFWITDQQIDNAKLVPIELTVRGDKSVKFKKLEKGVSNER